MFFYFFFKLFKASGGFNWTDDVDYMAWQSCSIHQLRIRTLAIKLIHIVIWTSRRVAGELISNNKTKYDYLINSNSIAFHPMQFH